MIEGILFLLTPFLLSAVTHPGPWGLGDASFQSSGWTITQDPIMEIAPSDGDGGRPWGRIVGVSRLSSGRVVVSDGLNRELSLYTPDGDLIQRKGGSGEGPGEFRILMAPMLCGGDSVYVWDPAQGRVSVFDQDLEYVRQFRDSEVRSGFPELARWHPEKMTCNGSGVFITTARSVAQMPRVEGPARVDMRVEVFSQGSPMAVVGPIPGDDLYLAANTLAPRPLGKKTTVSVSQDRLYVGTADSFSVGVYSLHGDRLGPVVDTVQSVEISNDKLDAYLSSRAEEHRSFYANLEYPGTFPSYSDLETDPDGNLWVEVYRPPGERRTTWRVYHREGQFVAALDVPEGFKVFEVGVDYLLGVGRDDLDVERVLMFGISKEG
jgi:hypothetical protein